MCFFFFQAEDGIRDLTVTGVQTCALPIYRSVESLDLFDGPGGKSGRPDLRRLRLIKSEEGGYSPKYRVRDAQGREWVAKLGPEAQSETAAVRLVWAAGYVTEINYLAPCAHIPGAKAPIGR